MWAFFSALGALIFVLDLRSYFNTSRRYMIAALVTVFIVTVVFYTTNKYIVELRPYHYLLSLAVTALLVRSLRKNVRRERNGLAEQGENNCSSDPDRAGRGVL